MSSCRKQYETSFKLEVARMIVDQGLAIRSSVRGYETHQQETIFARLTDTNKATIDQLLGEDDPYADDSQISEADDIEVLMLTHLRTDPGRPSLESLLSGIAKVKCIEAIGLTAEHFVGVSAKFIEQFRRRCASESIRELRRHPPAIRYSLRASSRM